MPSNVLRCATLRRRPPRAGFRQSRRNPLIARVTATPNAEYGALATVSSRGAKTPSSAPPSRRSGTLQFAQRASVMRHPVRAEVQREAACARGDSACEACGRLCSLRVVGLVQLAPAAAVGTSSIGLCPVAHQRFRRLAPGDIHVTAVAARAQRRVERSQVRR